MVTEKWLQSHARSTQGQNVTIFGPKTPYAIQYAQNKILGPIFCGLSIFLKVHCELSKLRLYFVRREPRKYMKIEPVNVTLYSLTSFSSLAANGLTWSIKITNLLVFKFAWSHVKG